MYRDLSSLLAEKSKTTERTVRVVPDYAWNMNVSVQYRRAISSAHAASALFARSSQFGVTHRVRHDLCVRFLQNVFNDRQAKHKYADPFFDKGSTFRLFFSLKDGVPRPQNRRDADLDFENRFCRLGPWDHSPRCILILL